MIPIDRKFKIKASCIEHSHYHDEDDSILFLVKDKALPKTLEAYRQECERLGCDQNQLLAIDLLIERVNNWQNKNQRKVKIADVDIPGPGESIIAPN